MFRLQNRGGQWLNKELNGFTYNLANAWEGTDEDIDRIGRLNKKWLSLEAIRV